MFARHSGARPLEPLSTTHRHTRHARGVHARLAQGASARRSAPGQGLGRRSVAIAGAAHAPQDGGVEAPGDVFYFIGLCRYQMAQLASLSSQNAATLFQRAYHYFHIAVQKEPRNRRFRHGLEAAQAVLGGALPVQEGPAQKQPVAGGPGRVPAHCG